MNKAVVLTLSLLANAALASLVYTRRSPANRVESATAATPAASAAVRPARATAAATAPDANASSPDTAAPDPADVSYLARLRAGGLPPDLIRELLYQRVQERYRDRIKALSPNVTREYWRSWTQAGWASLTPEARMKLRGIYKEIDNEIRGLLGNGPETLGRYERQLYDEMSGYLTPDKIQQVQAVQKDYDELMARVREQGKGFVLRADREQLRLLERERRADLAGLLSPDELLEYDLRTSNTSRGLRSRLGFFEPSEQEFRSIALLQLEFDRQYGLSDLSGEEQDRRHEAEKSLLPRIQAILTPERYADYLVTIDGMFSETRYFTNSYDLAPSAAKTIVALKQETWKRIDELDRTGIDPAQRQAALQAIEQEVNARLTTVLGASVFANYQRTQPSWLQRLRPAPAKP